MREAITDLDLLTKETITFKFNDGVSFTVPLELTIDLSFKMSMYQQKIQGKSVNEARLLIAEMVEIILSQDETQNANKIIKSLYPLQMIAVFNFYIQRKIDNENNKSLIAPFDVTKMGNSNSTSNDNRKASYFDVLADITYLASKINTSVNEIWQLPHSHYLSYLKHVLTSDLRQTEEGREILDKFERYMNPRKEADLSTIRQLSGYSTK